MLDCSEDVLLELIWRHKLHRVLRYLLHDLSNYLTGSLALSELYSESSSLDILADGMISIRDNCYREREILMRLSSLMHPQADAVTYIDLKNFLEDLMPIFRCILPSQTKVSLNLQADSSTIIRFKPEWLRRVFIQLICNCSEALQDVIAPEVVIERTLQNKHLICQIKDNGHGLSQEQLDTLKENEGTPFITNTKLRAGLYMVRFYLRKMGCSFKIESTVNSGFIATIIFSTIE